MSHKIRNSRVNRTLALIAVSAVVASCGGGGGGGGSTSPANPVVTPPPTQNTGIVGIVLTDAATDNLSAINLNVTEAVLIGDPGQQVVFQGSAKFNLLALENYDKPIAFAEVPVGSYTKLRLGINDVELVDLDGNRFDAKLPANGKIDLLEQGGFAVFPDRTLVVRVDIDADKSIHLVGNNNGYNMRPVVKAEFMNEGVLPTELARLEGRVDSIIDAGSGVFVLCSFDEPSSCLEVVLDDDGCVYDENGVPTTPDMISVDQEVIIIGRLRSGDGEDGDGDSDTDSDSGSDSDSDSDSESDSDSDSDSESDSDSDSDSESESDSDSDSNSDSNSDSDSDSDSESDSNSSNNAVRALQRNTDTDIVLGAIAVELGDASQTRGTVSSKPGDDGTFRIIDRDGKEVTVELQKGCTRVFGPAGEITDGSALDIGVELEIEGVIIPPSTGDGPTLLRAAVILIDGDDTLEQISGTIAVPIENGSFVLSTSGGDLCVVADQADILLLSSDGTEQKSGTFEDLEAGQQAEAFGEFGVDGCFLASELLVTLPE